MRSKIFLFAAGVFFLTTIASSKEVFACESCTIPDLGRNRGTTISESKDKKWFFKYLYEQQDWNEMPAAEAHELHEAGRHFHDKTREEFYHFSAGGHFADQFAVYTDIPYVIRESVEIEDHDRLGEREESSGWGDLHLIGDYRMFRDDRRSFGLAGGFKFPAGATEELNSVGTKFEPELQPGTGSVDYILGGIYEYRHDRVKFLGNVAYVFKTEGARDYRFGDLSSASLFVDYLLNPESASLKTEVGLNANVQYEQKHEDGGADVEDSGGTTLFLGPLVSVAANSDVSISGSALFPVYQDLGGVHQELDFAWTLAGMVKF